MSFRISGLPVEPFKPFYGLDSEALARAAARRYVADAKPGFPCRVTLQDAEPGEGVTGRCHVFITDDDNDLVYKVDLAGTLAA